MFLRWEYSIFSTIRRKRMHDKNNCVFNKKESVVQKNSDDWQSIVSKKSNKGVKNRSCLISNLILPVISAMKMVNL